MPDIVSMKLSHIDPNPMRRLTDYPYNVEKLDALEQSIREVGLWPGIMARKRGDRAEIAFGHHRLEAAKRALGSAASIPLVLENLTDEQMLQYMGRENTEDYNADFIVLLEAWEATEDWLSRKSETPLTAPEVARFLGWMRPHPQRNIDMTNDCAVACNEASKLIRGKYLKREELLGLSVAAAHAICRGVLSLHKDIEANAALGYRTPEEADEEKQIAGQAGAETAREAREGKIAKRDLRGQVGLNAYRVGQRAKRQTPLFETFAKTLIDQLFKVATDDSIGTKLNEIVKDIRAGRVKMRQDFETIARVAGMCESAEKRFAEWGRKLVVAATNKAKAVPPVRREPVKRIEVRR